MMANSLYRRLVILMVFLSLCAAATPAFAAGSEPVAGQVSAFSPEAQQGSSRLIIEPLKPVPIGTHPTITMRLTTALGGPIRNQLIRVFINDVRKASVTTDSNGVATAVLRFKFEAGTYHIKAVYYGVDILGVPSSTAEADLIVEASQVDIYTVPPLPGISVKFGNKIYTSDENGMIKVQVNQSGVYRLEVLSADPKKLPSNMRVEFARWGDQVFVPSRETYFPRPNHLVVGLKVSYQVDQAFYDDSGQLVDSKRVSSMTLRRYGELLTFDQAGPIWLAQNRVVGRLGGNLESQQIVYYFKEIIVDGVNVVNKSQQRFHVTPDTTWPVNLLLYSARFSGRDAMFHFPIGAGVKLTYPNGRVQEFPFGPEGDIFIPSLARGTYLATVVGAGGSAPTTPIHLSRDQEVPLQVLSILDLAVILGVPALVALALLYIGRPRMFRRPRWIPVPAFRTTKPV